MNYVYDKYNITLKYKILKEYEKKKYYIRNIKISIQDRYPLYYYFLSLNLLCLSLTNTFILQKTLAHPIEICIAKKKKKPRRKDAADSKKGVVREIPASPSAVFRGVSYLLHPRHEYELGPSRSGIGARPISCMLAPWATVSCCSGSSHCSALCNYIVYNPPPLYSFSESVTSLPSPPLHFCASPMPRVAQRASRRPWSRRGRRLRRNSRLRVPPLPSSSPCLIPIYRFSYFQ